MRYNQKIFGASELVFELVDIFTRAFYALVSLELTMALYRYFKAADVVLLLASRPGN